MSNCLTIAFHVAHFDARGTGDAIYNYAHYNEVVLKNKSVVIVHEPEYNPQNSNAKIKEKFKNRFTILNFTNKEHLSKLLTEEKCNALYYLCEGGKDGYAEQNFPEAVPLLVHCVFMMPTPYGSVYAAISDVIAEKWNQLLVVPHMVTLADSNKNLRKRLNIPKTATVFGRLGGADSFDIYFVFQSMLKILEQRADVYFLFAPLTTNHIVHPRVIYLDPITDSLEKRKFINSCDAMIHSSAKGESFGIACLEFSKANKPVITFPGINHQHLRNLKKAIVYKSQEDLDKILLNFKKMSNDSNDSNNSNENFDETENFAPEKVMKQFEKVFLSMLKK